MYTYRYSLLYNNVHMYMCLQYFFLQIVITAVAEASDLPVFVDNKVNTCTCTCICTSVPHKTTKSVSWLD